MGRRNSPQMILQFYAIEKCQNEYYPDEPKFNKFLQSYLLELLLFSIPLLKGICHHIENEKLLKGKFGHFS